MGLNSVARPHCKTTPLHRLIGYGPALKATLTLHKAGVRVCEGLKVKDAAQSVIMAVPRGIETRCSHPPSMPVLG